MTPQLVDEDTSSRLGAEQRHVAARRRRRPGVAGVLLKFVELKWIYLGDTLSYVGALIAVFLLPRLVAREDAERAELELDRAGFRTCGSSR
jgi:hypothetical protein